jgi:hypothetical protein
MSWATAYIRQLGLGNTVKFRPFGNSMEGIISSGQLCTVTPTTLSELREGDVVLCRVGNSDYLHLVKSISKHGQGVLIGNNKHHINGWTTKVYGKLIKVED